MKTTETQTASAELPTFELHDVDALIEELEAQFQGIYELSDGPIQCNSCTCHTCGC